METKDVASWQDEEAAKRFHLISSYISEDIDPAKRAQLRRETAAANNVSERTLLRYEAAWRNGQFAALRPKDRKVCHSSKLPSNFDELMAEAIQLKKEVPSRSVARIILIMEMEGLVPPGVLRRSTVQRHLYNAGFGVKQMKRYTESRNATSRRFCKPHRMMLTQCDIKYGLKFPVGPDNKQVQTYLSVLIDDHSRFLLEAHWYASQDAVIVEDTFHRAILKWGIFDVCMSDNGKQYVSTQLVRALERLGIRYIQARPYSPWVKGCVERFNAFVNSFLDEARLKNFSSLEELNSFWDAWVEEYYHKKPHEGLREYYESLHVAVPPEGISPKQEWERDSRPLKYLDAKVVAEAFLHHETRNVDKSGCIAFDGHKYEVSVSLAGRKVEIAYDPMAKEEITITGQGVKPFSVRPLAIPEYCDKKPIIPVSMQESAPDSSRFLDALKKEAEKSRKAMASAISFAALKNEED